MTEEQYMELKVGQRLRHVKGGYTVTLEHKCQSDNMDDLPVFWADCFGDIAVVTRPDLWDVTK